MVAPPLVALELKRELLEGQLSEPSQLALPAACALGGMLAPMAIPTLLNRGDAAAMNGSRFRLRLTSRSPSARWRSWAVAFRSASSCS